MSCLHKQVLNKYVDITMELMNGASQHTNVLTLTMTMYHFGFMPTLTILWTISRLRIMLQILSKRAE